MRREWKTGSAQETKQRRVNRGRRKSAKNGSYDLRNDASLFDFLFLFLIFITAKYPCIVVSVSLLITESENRRFVRITMRMTFVS